MIIFAYLCIKTVYYFNLYWNGLRIAGFAMLFSSLFVTNRRQWFIVVVTEHGMNQTHFS